MAKQELENLVKIAQLKPEAATRAEFDGMLSSARHRLADARNEDLSPESRFDLAYGAAHGLALAAMRLSGFRSANRVTVFQALTHTVAGLDPLAIRNFARCHSERNLAEYQGRTEVDDQLLKELIRYTTDLLTIVDALDPPPDDANP